eukprot:CAMPEP_0196762976 /NCGR_PEP_ID=MMETSP1095-20130614/3149_1 /TAXON_ID=96789 ORGANISM="Chromulina nebulosa, Strain UTEXLB2642" /NCGR_SAMPLE_ID=MMETSP1095 /ASSEMBLY_ACC=CAM_ASM_000446 /LENGTH=179 /DNA_ID=CAMNT_0042115181 /DNA_START=45 /DNA_END=587 /DNA_ORIENTATION=-
MNWLLGIITCLLLISLTIADKKKGDMETYLKRTGKKYLDDIAKKDGILKLKSGMLIEILKSTDKEDARSPTKFDSCDVTYSGTLKDGTKFDAGTTTFSPAQVIKGWTEAMQLMGEGDKWKLYIPYDLAYGERGSPPKIPPFSPLVFEIEIHKVKSTGGKPLADARKLLEESLVKEGDEL